MVSRPFAKKKKKNNIFRLQKEKKKNKYNKKTKVAIGRNLLIKALQNSFDFLDVEFKFLLTKSMKKVYKKKETYGRGKATNKITQPYVNKRNRSMFGEGRKKQHYKKQKGGAIASIFAALAPLAVD